MFFLTQDLAPKILIGEIFPPTKNRFKHTEKSKFDLPSILAAVGPKELIKSLVAHRDLTNQVACPSARWGRGVFDDRVAKNGHLNLTTTVFT